MSGVGEFWITKTRPSSSHGKTDKKCVLTSVCLIIATNLLYIAGLIRRFNGIHSDSPDVMEIFLCSTFWLTFFLAFFLVPYLVGSSADVSFLLE